MSSMYDTVRSWEVVPKKHRTADASAPYNGRETHELMSWMFTSPCVLARAVVIRTLNHDIAPSLFAISRKPSYHQGVG